MYRTLDGPQGRILQLYDQGGFAEYGLVSLIKARGAMAFAQFTGSSSPGKYLQGFAVMRKKLGGDQHLFTVWEKRRFRYSEKSIASRESLMVIGLSEESCENLLQGILGIEDREEIRSLFRTDVEEDEVPSTGRVGYVFQLGENANDRFQSLERKPLYVEGGSIALR